MIDLTALSDIELADISDRVWVEESKREEAHRNKSVELKSLVGKYFTCQRRLGDSKITDYFQIIELVEGVQIRTNSIFHKPNSIREWGFALDFGISNRRQDKWKEITEQEWLQIKEKVVKQYTENYFKSL